MVSLVTKEEMRQKQNIIFETLKKWNKSRDVTRLAEATASAEALGNAAKNNSEVG